MANLTDRQPLYVPDRFEQLRDAGTGSLRTVVQPVEATLAQFTDRFEDLSDARRGGFWIFRGQPGSGKSTFLDTIGLFRGGVKTVHIAFDADIAYELRSLPATGMARVVVIDGREALMDVSTAALESSMHSINTFVRSAQGKNTLVVWPTNTDDLTNSLIAQGTQLGGIALMSREPVVLFTGPPKSEYVRIAEKTIAALNEGASLTALGMTEEAAVELANEAHTVGDYLSEIRGVLRLNGSRVQRLMATEQPRVWTIVIAGNDPEGDVAALTRGTFAYADVDRLLTATNANVVNEVRAQPDTIGILGTVLDAKVLHLEIIAALAIARSYGNEALRTAMTAAGLSTRVKEADARNRLLASPLGVILAGGSLGPRKRGGKAGNNTRIAFNGLATIAQANDGLLNRAIAETIVAAGLADRYELEVEIGTAFRYKSDVMLYRGTEQIRLEMMWRTDTGQAAISNYVLTKLWNYAKAITLV